MVLKKYGYCLRSEKRAPSAPYEMIGILKYLETPARGSTVSEQAGPTIPT